MQAVERVWTVVWQLLVGWLISAAAMTVGFIWAILDVLWQLVAGGDGIGGPGSRVADVVAESIRWHAGQWIFIMTGGGDGRWRAIPDVL